MAPMEMASVITWKFPICSPPMVERLAQRSGMSRTARVACARESEAATSSMATSSEAELSPNHTIRNRVNSGATRIRARGSSRNGGGYS